ncbi:uncharacterized protein N7487_000573 [Penicillium crustosum]|uniref:uncharacterized protein n=1 Tax=Penicillium crustosum TaxID=36656 RepID=UPI002396547D|nr:uncharacterized protein N7487_000573 [Penicillium crustosum]KAJ5417023.1 hypothetical protein N7487_000573 [Penicillium crustosum]
MGHAPKRARTIESGACSHCVARRERCYIGVRGVPCSNCRRSNTRCDGIASQEITPKKRLPSRIYCDDGLFESQIRRTEQEQLPRARITADLPATDPLENYVSIMHQLLGPQAPDRSRLNNTPRYVSELPARLEVSDLDYLESKGALCLPTAPFRKQLLKSYILWAHPQVPVLDLDKFLHSIAANDGKTRISLLLFHAVMFAASAFVDISHIQEEGYMSRKVVREVLFRRVKVLLELNCEDDPISTVQALLLLIHWNDLPQSENVASHWIGVCLSLAISIGLHRNPDSSTLTSCEQKMRRRTWWSVHNHTRLTVENLLSVIRMQEDREDRNLFDIPMITLNDFQLHIFPLRCEQLWTILSRFSSILNRVQKVVCGEDIANDDVHLKPGSTQDEIEKYRRWQLQLPVSASHQCPLDLLPTDCERSIYLHQSWLRLLYLGSLYAACCTDKEPSGDSLAVSGHKSRSALIDKCLLDITEVLDEIDCLELSEQLPCPTSALLILVLGYHRQPSQASIEINARQSSRSLHKCWKILRKLKETSHLAARMSAAVEGTICDELWESISTIHLPLKKISLPDDLMGSSWGLNGL